MTFLETMRFYISVCMSRDYVYIEHIERNDATMKTGIQIMTKRNAKSNVVAIETPTIVLKTLHDDIMRDNANATCTTKSMRVWLRANMRDVHTHNQTWIFTQTQYDVVRSHFDVAYRAKIERATKRANATPRVRKPRAKSNDVANVETSNVETQNENA